MDSNSYIERKAMFPHIMDTFAEGIARMDGLQEIRIRCKRPVRILLRNREYAVNQYGKCCGEEEAFRMGQEQMDALLSHLCHYSIYAYEEEIRQAYFTLKGGHRVGITGQVHTTNDRITTIHPVYSLNIRIAHEISGCADSILPYLYRDGQLCNTLILSPPACGKTTILRDLIRQISNGGRMDFGRNVGVVDERCEIGGAHKGELGNDLGTRTDVMDSCPKAIGMMLLIRSMNPDVIAVDELGSSMDMEAIYKAISCGCKVIATIHGKQLKDLYHKDYMEKMLEEKIFERIVVLSRGNGAGTIEGIYDEKENPLQ